MSQLSKVDLKAENQLEFPNNNTGQITPANLRKFNVDMIDSTVNQTFFDGFSGSVASDINALEAFSQSISTNFVSSASFATFSQSVDTEITTLEADVLQLQTFSASLSGGFVTEGELAAATQSLINQINTKLDTASFDIFSQSVDSRLDNIEAATSSYANSASVAAVDAAQDVRINTLSGLTGSYATTGSNTFFGAQNIAASGGSASFGAQLVGFSGSLVIGIPSFGSGSQGVSYPINTAPTNLIFRNSSNTGTTIVSGSSNIFDIQSAPSAGFRREMRIGNYVMGNAVMQYSASMAFPVSNDFNLVMGPNTYQMRGPVSSSTYTHQTNIVIGNMTLGTSANPLVNLTSGLTVTGNVNVGTLQLAGHPTNLLRTAPTYSRNITLGTGTVTITFSSGSSNINSNAFLGATGNQIAINSFSGSAGTGSSTISNNIFHASTNLITISGQRTTTYTPSISNNAFLGGFNNIHLDTTTGRNLEQAIIAGNGLVISGSNVTSDTLDAYGTVIVGRYNINDGVKNTTRENVFVVGTGNANGRKNGLLIDSASNMFVEGTLNMSGSSNFNGNVIITGSLTASLADGFIYVGDGTGKTTAISTGSFAKTNASNTFTQNNSFLQNVTIAGNLYVSGSEVIVSSSTLIVGDRIIEVNANRVIGDAGIYAFDALTDQTGSMIWDPYVDYWKAGLSGSETRVITAADTASMLSPYITAAQTSSMTVLSASFALTAAFALNSTQIDTGSFITTSSFNPFSTSVDSRLDNLEAATSSYITSAQTSSLSVENALTASIARNLIVIARNGGASTLPAGTVVHITSAVGDNPIFTTASYDTEALSSNTFGLLRYSSPSGADVEVVVAGVVTGVDTDPALGYTAGDIVYLSSSGQFTRVQPQAPNQIVALGQVLRAQQNNGSIYVSINNGWELDELHNVQINSPQTGDIIQYESASYGLWKNKSISGAGILSTSSFNAATGAFATTGSNAFFGNNTFSGSLAFTGSAINLLSASTSGTVITNLTDTFTDVSRVEQIVTLTSASYAALVTGSLTNPNTLYIVSGSTSGSGGGTGAGFPFTGDAVISGSLTISGSAPIELRVTGGVVVTGSLEMTGSMRGNVSALTVASSTASINMDNGNFFTLSLPTGSTTRIEFTNIKAGQTINLQVTQGAASTGSVAFPSTVLFAGGFDYTPTAITGAVDLLSFVTFNTTSVIATAVKNLL